MGWMGTATEAKGTKNDFKQKKEEEEGREDSVVFKGKNSMAICASRKMNWWPREIEKESWGGLRLFRQCPIISSEGAGACYLDGRDLPRGATQSAALTWMASQKLAGAAMSTWEPERRYIAPLSLSLSLSYCASFYSHPRYPSSYDQ